MNVSRPDITVSIVSYNTRDLLHDCLKSLRINQQGNDVALEVVVADNASTDDSVRMVRDSYPDVRVIETGGNIGYGRANNAALAEAEGRYFFILNSDTEVEAGALQAMRGFMDMHPEVGMLGAQLILPDGSTQTSWAADPSLLAVFWEQTYLNKLLPRNRITGAYTMTGEDVSSQVREVPQVCGACFFVRREAWEQIGGFDPAYFMYFEDTDFCVRLRGAGWPVYFFPDARIKHHLGASSSDWQTRARMIASYNQSRYYFFTHHGGPLKGRLLKAFTLIGSGLRLAAWSLLSIFRPAAREQRQLFREVWRLTWAMRTS